jgi:organic hydroperoxide reductase OsmC/OhrA
MHGAGYAAPVMAPRTRRVVDRTAVHGVQATPVARVETAARGGSVRPGAHAMAHAHTADVRWKRTSERFLQGAYSRAHEWAFDGGAVVAASPSPSVVPAPWSDPAAVDPEEAFVASIASCHMLTFLWLAGKAGHVVDAYEDHATGWLEKNERGVPWLSRVELRPRIAFAGAAPDAAKLDELHHRAHEQCYIANSVRTAISVLPPA